MCLADHIYCAPCIIIFKLPAYALCRRGCRLAWCRLACTSIDIVTCIELLISRCRFRLLLLFMFIQQLDTSAGCTSVTHTQSVTSRVSVCHMTVHPKRRCSPGECTQTLSRNSTPDRFTQFPRNVPLSIRICSPATDEFTNKSGKQKI